MVGISFFLRSIGASVRHVLPCFILSTEAFSFDVHELFEGRCGGCHQHAGDLARESLVIADGILRGQTSRREIRALLPAHYGNLNPMEAEALYDLLLWQNGAGGEFKARCAICHIRARELAQTNLVRDGDVLRGRYSDRDMTEFLTNHGRIEAMEVDFFIQLLMRLAPTIGQH